MEYNTKQCGQSVNEKPLAIDLYCGLGGWASGLLAENWRVIGCDIERHVYGDHAYPAQLVLQDVLTIHGSQFRQAALIVCSPPCQFFSYVAMPWSRAKQLARDVRADPERLAKELALFNACFRIQREACEAAGRHIPMVVENVRGAIPWVGRSRWNFGSYHLWGDVPALMPMTFKGVKSDGSGWRENGTLQSCNRMVSDGTKVPGMKHGVFGPGGIQQKVVDGYKSSGMNWSDQTKRGQDFTRIAGKQAMEAIGQKGVIANLKNGKRVEIAALEGLKVGDSWFGKSNDCSPMRQHSSKSPGRKAASAMIAKIPEPLARHIARTYYPN